MKSPEFSDRTLDAAKVLSNAAEIKRLCTVVDALTADLRDLRDVARIGGANAVAAAMTAERDRVYEHMRMLGGKIGPLERQAEHLRNELFAVEAERDKLRKERDKFRDALMAREGDLNHLHRELRQWKRRAMAPIGPLLTKANKAKPRVIYDGPIGKLLNIKTFPLSRSKTPQRVEKLSRAGASIKRRSIAMAKKPKGGRKGGKGC